ncbi:MAG: hypothetical protein WCR47_02685 [Desulfoplanes sp.]
MDKKKALRRQCLPAAFAVFWDSSGKIVLASTSHHTLFEDNPSGLSSPLCTNADGVHNQPIRPSGWCGFLGQILKLEEDETLIFIDCGVWGPETD